jgi:hypothetical protein
MQHPELCRELISLTPENWKSILLLVKTEQGGLRIWIKSQDGHTDHVQSSANLDRLVGDLAQVYRDRGEVWQSAEYRVWQSNDDEWKFEVYYDYEASQT